MFSSLKRQHDPKPRAYVGTLLIALLLVVGLPMLLLGCAQPIPSESMTPTSGPQPATEEVAAVKTSAWDGFCTVALPIPWQATMANGIILRIKQHNHLGAVHCGWPE
jgi:hypothetical protein